MSGFEFRDPAFLLLLALAIAIFLWGIASGTSNAERGFDIPVVLDRLPDSLVVTDQNTDSVNVRVMGSQIINDTFVGLSKLDFVKSCMISLSGTTATLRITVKGSKSR